MDAADDNKDIKLYRASSDLLPELEAKLPQLVRHTTGSKRGEVRKWVLERKTNEIILRLDRFQEWPQLLDPHLQNFIQILTDAFLSYVATSGNSYGAQPSVSMHVSPLPRAVSRLLYVFCKVRGPKVIVRLLNNEPRHLEPLLAFLAQRFTSEQGTTSMTASRMVWEERYILLLWLSHLMLTPFDLSSVSSLKLVAPPDNIKAMTDGLSNVAVSVLAIGVGSLFEPSKAREAASALLVRLALRQDMQAHQLLAKLISFATDAFGIEAPDPTITPYHYVGYLSLLYGVLRSGSDTDVAPFIHSIFSLCVRLATGGSSNQIAVRSTAPVRKLLIKIIRAAMLHAIYLNSKHSPQFNTEVLDSMLENAIQYLLDALSDKDTPVRMAASKNLAMIVLKLEDSMSAEVVQAVLDSLNENLLLEHRSTGTVAGVSDILDSELSSYRRNISAVDPLKWQGLMLTLGHLLFRRSPPLYQLATIIEALISGLHFEQRSNVGSSLGVGVRDAACFGVWSLARKYSTTELLDVDTAEIGQTAAQLLLQPRSKTVLQMLATELVVSACADPSGNIRRGSSAALQELIGRHPDIIAEGIPLVQIVDYHAVARRSHAMRDVAVEAANLDTDYRLGLLNALLDWRGAKAADPDSRRSAAAAIALLAKRIPQSETEALCEAIVDQLSRLKSANIGITAECRHGLLLTLAEIIGHAYPDEDKPSTEVILGYHHAQTPFSGFVSKLWKCLAQILGNLASRVTRDLELVLEAASSLIAALASSDTSTTPDTKMIMAAMGITERCLTASEKDNIVTAATEAAVALFQVLEQDAQMAIIARWTSLKDSNNVEFKSKGRIIAIGRLLTVAADDAIGQSMSTIILSCLRDFAAASWPIETRVSAMTSLTNIISTRQLSPETFGEFEPILLAGLTDYTVDQRGDVGSIFRYQSIEAVEQLLLHTDPSEILTNTTRRLVQEVVKLAGEKLSKIRARAWTCFSRCWMHVFRSGTLAVIARNDIQTADCSSTSYYASLLELYRIPWLQHHLTLGLILSATAGTEDIGRASCSAFVTYFLALSTTERDKMVQIVHDVLLDYLATCSVTDDRNLIPTIEFLAFLLEQGLFSEDVPPVAQEELNSSDIWIGIARIHTKTATIQQLETITKLYSSLCIAERHRTKAVDKLTRLLLHRFPKIRAGAADTLFLHTGDERLISCDWTAPVAQLKPTVIQLRRALGVTNAPVAAS